ncbi:MAG: hypothetical protein M1445_04265 [Bacteroidetes bacterium]|nr:hypothetical protein [Bacteroidota bacterium]
MVETLISELLPGEVIPFQSEVQGLIFVIGLSGSDLNFDFPALGQQKYPEIKKTAREFSTQRGNDCSELFVAIKNQLYTDEKIHCHLFFAAGDGHPLCTV